MIPSIYKNRKNFIIVGLTGRIGSGCSTAAKFLATEQKEHKLKDLCIDDSSNDKNRKKFIVDKFYKKNWKPFTTIRASDIIITYILKYNFDEFNNILKEFDEKVEEAQTSNEENEPALNKRLKLYGKIIQLEKGFKVKYNEAHEKFKGIFNKDGLK